MNSYNFASRCFVWRIVCISLVVGTAAYNSHSIAIGQDVPVSSPTSNPKLVPWQPVTIPDSEDLEVLSQFLTETKKRQPVQPDQYVEMQRALRTVSKRIVELTKDHESPEFRRAEAEYVNASVMLLGNDGPEAQRKTFERFRDYFKERSKVEFNDIQMAMLAGQNLEQLSDYKLAKEAYTTFADVFREKKDPSLVAIIAMFEANARRLDLPGRVFSMTGTSLSGDAFRVDSLRGSIVLIYFWSSISKPCELEHPYMLSIYNKFRARGFEIVGISLDERKEDAKAFEQKLQMPWVNLWDSTENGVAKSMETFGVNVTPSTFLLDKDGRVITIEARGLLLGKALEKLLPDVVEKP